MPKKTQGIALCVFSFFLSVLTLVASPTIVRAHDEGDSEEIAYIKGPGIDLVVEDHAFQGTIKGTQVMALSACGGLPQIRVEKYGEVYTAHLNSFNQKNLYGLILDTYYKDHVAEVYLKSANFAERMFVLEVNGKEVTVTFDYETKEGSHYQNVNMYATIEGEDFHFNYSGKGCPNLLGSFTMMIIAAYVF